jgi:hemolysin III
VTEAPAVIRPRLRGVLHQWAAPAATIGGALLVVLAPTGAARAAAAVYGASLVAMLATSAAYHRIAWPTERARARMRALDHAMIFVVIAGTYTPACALALREPVGDVLLAVVWAGAALGAVVELRWPTGPRWRSSLAYLLVGWVAVVAIVPLVDAVGGTVLALLAAGGVLYSAGAVVYARGRPDPWPATFGFHEVFHALVVAAAALHFAAVAAIVASA